MKQNKYHEYVRYHKRRKKGAWSNFLKHPELNSGGKKYCGKRVLLQWHALRGQNKAIFVERLLLLIPKAKGKWGSPKFQAHLPTAALCQAPPRPPLVLREYPPVLEPLIDEDYTRITNPSRIQQIVRANFAVEILWKWAEFS
jgi:hypothetical protein